MQYIQYPTRATAADTDNEDAAAVGASRELCPRKQL